MRPGFTFVLLVAAGAMPAHTLSGSAAAPAQAAQTVTGPVAVRQETPRYTSEALRAGIEGLVELRAVVLPNGTVGSVEVVKSLDTRYGLDESAVEAARRWVFRPAMADGQPVPATVTLVLEFRQHGGRQQAPVRPDDDDFTRGAYRVVYPDVVAPVVRRFVAPKYTSGAMRARIQGIVVAEAVVDTDGRISRIRVRESLDKEFGLDDMALTAARQWEFEPGTFEGRPVPVLIEVRLEFRLHE